MVLTPSASEAMATARIVCDFEAGIAAVPFNRDLLITSFITPFFTKKPQKRKEYFFSLFRCGKTTLVLAADANPGKKRKAAGDFIIMIYYLLIMIFYLLLNII